MKKLLILTGPQGSGNHMWSKIFAQHPQVYGWKELLSTYWIGHDKEPFAEYWLNPDKLKDFNWDQSDYYVTSVSVPYMNNGTQTVPNIIRFAATAMGCGISVDIAIIGRDRNILDYQQTRVREKITRDLAHKEYAKLESWNPQYLSYELLQLYGTAYLKQLSTQLEFPIAYNDHLIKEHFISDANARYLQAGKPWFSDELAKKASSKHTHSAERILIMGLPGAGKTYLAQYTLEKLENAGKTVTWLNADLVREQYNDWDFSVEGRLRQSLRMRELADNSNTDYVICDFIAPLAQMRSNFDADWTVWVDTIASGRFEDTNKIFEPPDHWDFRITEQDAPRYSELVAHSIINNIRK